MAVTESRMKRGRIIPVSLLETLCVQSEIPVQEESEIAYAEGLVKARCAPAALRYGPCG